VASQLLQGKNTYAPIKTLYLGAGDDIVVGDSRAYEWFYPGGGNNVIGSLAVDSDYYQTYEPTYRSGSQNVDVKMSDVVVYTDGSSQDYLIIREANAIKVVKPDKSVDYLFGISLIKFETTDATSIIVPKARLAGLDKVVKPTIDVFGNTIDNRVFVSRAVNEDGGIADVRLYGTGYDRDIVRLDKDIIYQPGSISKADAIELPNGTQSFTLSKQQLLSRFTDNDISSKKLYTIDQIQIENLSIYRGSAVISKATKQADGSYTVDLLSPLDSTETAISIGYEVVEPEGYRHFSVVDLNLSASTESSTIKVAQGGTAGDSLNTVISSLSELTRTKALTTDANALLSKYKLFSDPTAQSVAIDSETAFFGFHYKNQIT